MSLLLRSKCCLICGKCVSRIYGEGAELLGNQTCRWNHELASSFLPSLFLRATGCFIVFRFSDPISLKASI